jgi:hypothetical protein
MALPRRTLLRLETKKDALRGQELVISRQIGRGRELRLPNARHQDGARQASPEAFLDASLEGRPEDLIRERRAAKPPPSRSIRSCPSMTFHNQSRGTQSQQRSGFAGGKTGSRLKGKPSAAWRALTFASGRTSGLPTAARHRESAAAVALCNRPCRVAAASLSPAGIGAR